MPIPEPKFLKRVTTPLAIYQQSFSAVFAEMEQLARDIAEVQLDLGSVSEISRVLSELAEKTNLLTHLAKKTEEFDKVRQRIMQVAEELEEEQSQLKAG